jgi:hypothetical protein
MKIEDFVNNLIVAYEQKNEEVDLNKICDSVEKEYSTRCTNEYIGGFDSPGYSIDCYAIAFVDEEEEIIIVPYTSECY